MLNVTVLDRDERMARSLLVLLGQLFVTAYAGSDMISCPGAQPELLLCRCGGKCHIAAGRCILVGVEIPTGFVPPPGALMIAESGNAAAMGLAAGYCLPVLRCGLSQTDCMTLSSINEGGAVLSLSRPVLDLYGAPVEPFDLPLRLSRMPMPFALLAASAVTVAAGRVSSLGGIIF